MRTATLSASRHDRRRALFGPSLHSIDSDIGHAEARERVAHVLLEQDAANAGKVALELRHRAFFRERGRVELVEQRRAGNLHIDAVVEGQIEAADILRLQREQRRRSRTGRRRRNLRV